MKLNVQCTSCARKNNLEYQKMNPRTVCDGREDMASITDGSGSCCDFLSPLDAERTIKKVREKKKAAIERAHAPLTYSPFRILKR